MKNPTKSQTKDLSKKKLRTCSFGPEFRLHYPREYRCFFNGSEMLRFTECIAFRIPNNLNHYRLGITLKARGISVERNRIKRQIRESFRKQAQALGNFDYNVVVPVYKKLDYLFSRRLGKTLRSGLKNVFGDQSD